MKALLIIFPTVLSFAVPAPAKDKVTSSYSAELLLLFAAGDCHLAHDKNPGRYYVGGVIDRGEYFQIDLRRTDNTLPPDWVGSDLAGWFGIRKKDGAIVEWNVADDTPGNSIEKKPNQSSQPTRSARG